MCRPNRGGIFVLRSSVKAAGFYKRMRKTKNTLPLSGQLRERKGAFCIFRADMPFGICEANPITHSIFHKQTSITKKTAVAAPFAFATLSGPGNRAVNP